MTIQRKTPPTAVAWDQQNILARLRDLEAVIADFTKSTSNPSSDASATLVRNVRDYEILERLDQVVEQLERLNTHLVLMTGNQLSIGEIS